MMPDEPVMIAYSPCLGCGRVFGYDPYTVTTIRYCPMVRNSLELALIRLAEVHDESADSTGHAGPADECGICEVAAKALTENAVKEPCCPDCLRAANPERVRNGLEPADTVDTADRLIGDQR
jgi:hypothetical protein